MDELNSLLDQFDQRQETNKRRAEEHSRASDAYAKQFLELQGRVILPALNQLHEQLAQRGHALKIRGHGSKEIVMEVVPRGSEEIVRKTHVNQRPHLSFTHLEGSSKVQVYECKMRLGGGGQAGVSITPEFSEVNPELVQSLAMGILRIAL